MKKSVAELLSAVENSRDLRVDAVNQTRSANIKILSVNHLEKLFGVTTAAVSKGLSASRRKHLDLWCSRDEAVLKLKGLRTDIEIRCLC